MATTLGEFQGAIFSKNRVPAIKNRVFLYILCFGSTYPHIKREKKVVK